MNHCPGVDPWLSTLSKVCLVLYTVPRRASVGGFAAGTSAPISKDLFSQWKCIEMGIQPAKIATLLSDPHHGIFDSCSDSKCATRHQEEECGWCPTTKPFGRVRLAYARLSWLAPKLCVTASAQAEGTITDLARLAECDSMSKDMVAAKWVAEHRPASSRGNKERSRNIFYLLQGWGYHCPLRVNCLVPEPRVLARISGQYFNTWGPLMLRQC